MYIDRLDGRVDKDFFDRKAAEQRRNPQKCPELICGHPDPNPTYFDENIQILEMAQKAGRLFRQQSSAEKRRFLGFVLSICAWKIGRLFAEYRQPFDSLSENVIALETKKPADRTQTGISDNWLPGTGSNRRPSG